MIVKLYVDELRDRELMVAINAMPKGERSTRLKSLLTLALAGTGGLLVRMDALERRLHALEETPKTAASQLTYGSDAMQTMQSLLNGLDDL